MSLVRPLIIHVFQTGHYTCTCGARLAFKETRLVPEPLSLCDDALPFELKPKEALCQSEICVIEHHKRQSSMNIHKSRWPASTLL